MAPSTAPSEFLIGELGCIAIWSQALTAAQIQTNWNKVLTGNEPGLIGCWNFSNGTADDITTNHYTGTLYGDAAIVPASIPALTGAGVGSVVLTAPGPYSITGLPAGPGYAVTAFLDVQTNGVLTSGDPVGAYSGNPFTLGTANLTNVNVVLQEAPYITAQPVSERRAPGATASFSVTAAGTAPFSYQWVKDSQDLTDGGRISGSQTSQLQITGLTTADSGAYYVVVSNVVGGASSDAANSSWSRVASPSQATSFIAEPIPAV